MVISDDSLSRGPAWLIQCILKTYFQMFKKRLRLVKVECITSISCLPQFFPPFPNATRSLIQSLLLGRPSTTPKWGPGSKIATKAASELPSKSGPIRQLFLRKFWYFHLVSAFQHRFTFQAPPSEAWSHRQQQTFIFVFYCCWLRHFYGFEDEILERLWYLTFF